MQSKIAEKIFKIHNLNRGNDRHSNAFSLSHHLASDKYVVFVLSVGLLLIDFLKLVLIT